MDEKAQKQGEKRVRELVVTPLIRLGLMKPAGMTKALFEEMQEEICQRLAYMDALSLRGLCEELAGCGGGKERDRFPLATVVLERAVTHQRPVSDASPLMRAVFAHAIGEGALEAGFAPELMKWVRENRKWPGSYVMGKIAESGRDGHRRLDQLQRHIADGRELLEADAVWLKRRLAAVARCQEARDLGLAEKKVGA